MVSQLERSESSQLAVAVGAQYLEDLKQQFIQKLQG